MARRSATPVTMSSSRRISRSTTTAYSPSLPPKCSYTTGLDTPAFAAISSTDVPSKPFVGEQGAADLEQLLTALRAGHPGAARAPRLAHC